MRVAEFFVLLILGVVLCTYSITACETAYEYVSTP
jgi:predicted small secreted protein